MKTALPLRLTVALFTLALTATWASAAVSLQFTQASVSGAPGQTVQVTLQLVTTSEGVNALDYWLAQTAGPLSGAISIAGPSTTRGSGDFPNPSASDAVVTSSGDTFNNTTGAPSSPDATADNRILPRNGPDLGATKNSSGTNFGAGTYNVGTFTLQIAANATPGTYTISTFDYSGFGWSGVGNPDNAFSSQGSINIVVAAVPEPSTWALLAFGGMGALAVNMLRNRRHA